MFQCRGSVQVSHRCGQDGATEGRYQGLYARWLLAAGQETGEISPGKGGSTVRTTGTENVS